jgi:hypothetical protein
MKKLIDKLLNAARKYNLWDFGFFKITLISLGILLGSYFSQFFLKYISVVCVIFIVTLIWVLYKTFIKYMD